MTKTRKTYRTRNYGSASIDSPSSTWVRVSMEEWDRLSEHNREILMTKDGTVFVKRITK